MCSGFGRDAQPIAGVHARGDIALAGSEGKKDKRGPNGVSFDCPINRVLQGRFPSFPVNLQPPCTWCLDLPRFHGRLVFGVDGV